MMHVTTRTEADEGVVTVMPGEGKGRRWGIGQILVMLVLVALLPFILLETYRSVQDVNRSRTSVTARALGQVEEEAETMEDFVRYTDRYLSTLAVDPTIRSLDPARIDSLLQNVRDLNPNYINVFLLAPDGTQISSTEPLVVDEDIEEKPYFQEALTSGRMAISSALAWPGTGTSVVVFAKRVNGVDGEPVAVLCAALNLARLSTVIGFVALPEDSVVLLVQRDGTVIAASANPEDWTGQSIQGNPLFENAWAKRTGTGTVTLTDGVERVVGYELVRASPWLMIAGIPQAEVDSVIRDSLSSILLRAILAGLATALLAWIVLRRVVVPIRMLSDGARAFAAGFLNRRVPLKRNDELGDLADSLNQMAASLEQRIEEEEAHARALRDLNRLQAEFVATASHELRTPVTAIRTYAEALMRPDITDVEIERECLEGIDRASNRLARLAKSLLDVSRIDRGQVPVVLGPVDAIAAIKEAAAQADAGGNGDTIQVDVPLDLPPVRADADRLEDVLANLIGNARKFSPPGMAVVVRARRVAGDVEITIEDRGPGIPPTEHERIFDRFYQVQRGADRQVGGSGLGLYIARGYISAMDGRIWVESVPGHGSTFSVALPVYRAAASQPKEEREDAGIAGAARSG
ncbi:MAG: ATP-binding protein [Dehalococcoidia bacterium]